MVSKKGNKALMHIVARSKLGARKEEELKRSITPPARDTQRKTKRAPSGQSEKTERTDTSEIIFIENVLTRERERGRKPHRLDKILKNKVTQIYINWIEEKGKSDTPVCMCRQANCLGAFFVYSFLLFFCSFFIWINKLLHYFNIYVYRI